MQGNALLFSRARNQARSERNTFDEEDSDEELGLQDRMKKVVTEQLKYKSFWVGVQKGINVDSRNPKVVPYALSKSRTNQAKDGAVSEKALGRLFDPQARNKVIWDVFICVIVVYSIIVIPVRLGFDTEPDGASLILDYIITAIFAIDIAVSFNTAYIDAETESLVTNRKLVAKNYLKFWFWIDFFSTIPFDDIIGAILSIDDLSAIRAIRILRLVRLFKLYRLANLNDVLEKYNINPAIVNLITLILQIFFVAHMFACFWHFIALDGTQNPEPPRNWVTVFGFEDAHVNDKYVASLYYIIVTMLTVGYGDISPTNDVERVYGILTMLTGAVVFGALISKVANIIEKRNPQAKAFKENMMQLKSYLVEFQMPKDLKKKIKTAYGYYLERKTAFGDTSFIDDLPQPMMHRLMRQLYDRDIRRVRLFHSYEKNFVVPLLQNCVPIQAIKGEQIYGYGDVMNEIVFVPAGRISLSIFDGVRDLTVGYVSEGFYFGDMEYLRNTSSVAAYTALSHAELLAVKHSCFDTASAASYDAGIRFREEITGRYRSFVEVQQAHSRKSYENLMSKSAASTRFKSVSNSAGLTGGHGGGEGGVEGTAGTTVSGGPEEGSEEGSDSKESIARLEAQHTRQLVGELLNRRSSSSRGRILPASATLLWVDGQVMTQRELTMMRVHQNAKHDEIIESSKEAEESSLKISDLHMKRGGHKGKLNTNNPGHDAQSECSHSRGELITADALAAARKDGGEEELAEEDEEELDVIRAWVMSAKGKAIVRPIYPSYLAEHRLFNPKGKRKILWDFFIGIWIVYSVMVVPVEIAFNSLAFEGSDILDFVVSGFFIMDIFFSFRTAYEDDEDILVTVPSMIAANYAQTWFPIDLVSSIPFDAIVGAAASGGAANLGFTKLIKILRLFRLFKLARVLRLGAYLEAAEDELGLSPAIFELIGMFVVVFFIAHWVACILWGMSTVLSENRWYQQDDLVFSDFESKTLAQQYLVSLYWTFTIMSTVGYGDISPINSNDRLLNIFVILLGASIFGYMIANVSGLLDSLNATDAVKSEKLSGISDFLDEQQCPVRLRNDIMNHFRNMYKDESAFEVESVLNCLPPKLGNKILLVHHERVLKSIPLLRFIDNESVRLYVFQLMSAAYYDEKQFIIKEGDPGDEIVFIVSGRAVAFRKALHPVDAHLNGSEADPEAGIDRGFEGEDECGPGLQTVEEEQVMEQEIGHLMRSKSNEEGLALSPPPHSSAADDADGKQDEEENEVGRKWSHRAVRLPGTLEEALDASADEVADAELVGDVEGATAGPRPRRVSFRTTDRNSTDHSTDTFDMQKRRRSQSEYASSSLALGQRVQSLRRQRSASANLANGGGGGKRPSVEVEIDPDADPVQRAKLMEKNHSRFVSVSQLGSCAFELDVIPEAGEELDLAGEASQRGTTSGAGSVEEGTSTTEGFESSRNRAPTMIDTIKMTLGLPDSFGLSSLLGVAAGQKLHTSSFSAETFESAGMQLIGELHPGDFCGHVAMMHNSVHHASVVARGPVQVYTISKAEIARLLRVEPTVGLQLQAALGQAISAQADTVGKFHMRRSRAHFLRQLKKDFYRAHHVKELDIALAMQTGVCAPSVDINKELHKRRSEITSVVHSARERVGFEINHKEEEKCNLTSQSIQHVERLFSKHAILYASDEEDEDIVVGAGGLLMRSAAVSGLGLAASGGRGGDGSDDDASQPSTGATSSHSTLSRKRDPNRLFLRTPVPLKSRRVVAPSYDMSMGITAAAAARSVDFAAATQGSNAPERSSAGGGVGGSSKRRSSGSSHRKSVRASMVLATSKIVRRRKKVIPPSYRGITRTMSLTDLDDFEQAQRDSSALGLREGGAHWHTASLAEVEGADAAVAGGAVDGGDGGDGVAAPEGDMDIMQEDIVPLWTNMAAMHPFSHKRRQSFPSLDNSVWRIEHTCQGVV